MRPRSRLHSFHEAVVPPQWYREQQVHARTLVQEAGRVQAVKSDVPRVHSF
jgi:hypothetical protein